MSNKWDAYDQRYIAFTRSLGLILKENKSDGRSRIERLNDLIKAEKRFKSIMFRNAGGRAVYKKFIHHIVRVEGNRLKARAFFRERQGTFTKYISPALKNEDHIALSKFNINHKFCKWALENYEGSKRDVLIEIFNEIEKTRNLICEDAIPLAIHSANLFYGKIKYSTLEHSDIVQDATEGLLHAIDKFVVGKSKFHHVAIGRMLQNTSYSHNQPLLSMSPTEKRILYRTKMGIGKGLKGEELVSFIQESFPNASRNKVADLINAESKVSGTTNTEGGESESKDIVENFVSEESIDPSFRDEENAEDAVIAADLQLKLLEHLESLAIIEQKAIRMRFGI